MYNLNMCVCVCACVCVSVCLCVCVCVSLCVSPSVLCEPAERGGDPAAVPAASGSAAQRHGSRAPPGVLPPHGLQPLLPAHPPQRHAGLQHRHRSASLSGPASGLPSSRWVSVGLKGSFVVRVCLKLCLEKVDMNTDPIASGVNPSWECNI